MNAAIVYTSKHKGNTERVAEAMAEVMGARLVKTEDCEPGTAKDCGLIGFGSGVYKGGPDKSLLGLIKRMDGRGRKAFAFTTSGGGKDKYTEKIADAAKESGFDVVGTFSSRGFVTWGPFKLFGGGSKGRPNEEDLERARSLAKKLKA